MIKNWMIEQGWVDAGVEIRCGEGHEEELLVNKNFPGVLLHESCGGYTYFRIGVIKEVVIRKAHFMRP